MADDNNVGTEPQVDEAQPQADQATEPATQTGTPDLVAEVTTLRSRQAGQDAKITALLKSVQDAEAARNDLQARLDAALNGQAGESEFAERLAAKDREIAALKIATVAADRKGKFPEAAAELPQEVFASLDEAALASLEARLTGVPVESNAPPPPVGNNAARQPAGSAKRIEEMSLAELKAHGSQVFAGLTWDAITQAE
jgi:hypothetical protein